MDSHGRNRSTLRFHLQKCIIYSPKLEALQDSCRAEMSKSLETLTSSHFVEAGVEEARKKRKLEAGMRDGCFQCFFFSLAATNAKALPKHMRFRLA